MVGEVSCALTKSTGLEVKGEGISVGECFHLKTITAHMRSIDFLHQSVVYWCNKI